MVWTGEFAKQWAVGGIAGAESCRGGGADEEVLRGQKGAR